MPVTFITGRISRCLTIKLTLKGGAKWMHEQTSSPFGPLPGLYNRSWNTCDYPNWARYLGSFPDKKYQKIWFHIKADADGNDCGKKVSKGKGKSYWKVGEVWQSALDSWDTKASVDQTSLYPYSRNISSVVEF